MAALIPEALALELAELGYRWTLVEQNTVFFRCALQQEYSLTVDQDNVTVHDPYGGKLGTYDLREPDSLDRLLYYLYDLRKRWLDRYLIEGLNVNTHDITRRRR